MWNGAIAFSTPTVTKTPSGIKQTTDVWGRPIRANFKDVTRDDEILAKQFGYTAEQNVEIHKSSYNGQSYFKDVATCDIYDIRRTFRGDGKMTIILTCERRERGKVVPGG